MKRFKESLLQAAKRRTHEIADLQRREAELQRKTGNLTRALADGYSPSLRSDLGLFESQLQDVRAQLARVVGSTAAIQIRNTCRFVEARLASIRGILNDEPVMVRAEIAKHVEKITLTPETNLRGSRDLEFAGAWQHGWCQGPVVYIAVPA